MDFETTWLDPKKDEPIQIGIVEIDIEGKIIGHYQSLIKPVKKTDELKHIVWFITGFSLADLEHAPTREKVLDDIQDFFGEHTVLIWHNIQFDIDFLKNYFPSLPFTFAIDTFQLAQTLVHYAPSYALEVLIHYLQKKEKNMLTRLDAYGLVDTEDTFHDALHDSKNALALCMYLFSRVQKLVDAYPNLTHFLAQKKSYFSNIFVLSLSKTKLPIQFPVLQKISPSAISGKKDTHHLDLATLEVGKRYYIGNVDSKTFFLRLLGNKRVILCFSNLQKLEIAKSCLHQLGIKNLWFLKEEQTINESKFSHFLNKASFSHEEVLFVIKYLSHLHAGYGTLHLSTKHDHQIYAYLKDTRDQIKYPFVLTTHSGLFSSLNDMGSYQDYAICFFDLERWYKSYNFFLSRPCDLYYTLNFLETLLYKKSVDGQIDVSVLQDFYHFFQIFIWEISIETKKLFTNTTVTSLQHDPLLGHGNFYQTTKLLNQIPGYLEKIKDEINDADFTELSRQIAHMLHVFDNVMLISKKMYGQSDFYFVYAEHTKFTSWQEFFELFRSNPVYFLSNTTTTYPHLWDDEKKPGISIQFFNEKYDHTLDYVSAHLNEKKCFFIVSTQKEQSKKLFEEMYEKHIHEKASLLVENITGGVGKNIFKAAQQDDAIKILIWGYSFLLYAYASAIPIDELLVFNINGASKQHVLDDILWYAPK